MGYLSRPYRFKFFKGCLPQILLGPFLNTLSHMSLIAYANAIFEKYSSFFEFAVIKLVYYSDFQETKQ